MREKEERDVHRVLAVGFRDPSCSYIPILLPCLSYLSFQTLLETHPNSHPRSSINVAQLAMCLVHPISHG